MKNRELLATAMQEIDDENQVAAMVVLKERARELKAAEMALAKLAADFDKLLEQDVDEHIFDE